MKNRIRLIVALFLSSQCLKAQNSTFTINGHLEKIKKGIIVLNIYEGDKTLRDSAPIDNGNFKFTGNVPISFFATLTMKRKPDNFFSFYIEPTTIEISGRGDSLKLLAIKGSPINEDDRLLKERMKYISAWQETNSKIYEKAYKEKDKKTMDSLDEVDFDISS